MENPLVLRAVEVDAAHGDGHHFGARRLDRRDHLRVRRVLARADHQPRAELAPADDESACRAPSCDRASPSSQPPPTKCTISSTSPSASTMRRDTRRDRAGSCGCARPRRGADRASARRGDRRARCPRATVRGSPLTVNAMRGRLMYQRRRHTPKDSRSRRVRHSARPRSRGSRRARTPPPARSTRQCSGRTPPIATIGNRHRRRERAHERRARDPPRPDASAVANTWPATSQVAPSLGRGARFVERVHARAERERPARRVAHRRRGASGS